VYVEGKVLSVGGVTGGRMGRAEDNTRVDGGEDWDCGLEGEQD
jgi:hypothetical protein